MSSFNSFLVALATLFATVGGPDIAPIWDATERRRA